ncbi:alpha-amylase family glycosyl hydrolase [Halobacillus amylolyticus]|uniref:Alpha-amylase family glycosyl hydrolase n=1 Tax=Halobacillus amylolyticus TaxID=2932259 RepID=A0ABY4HF48_9BACI|nr:alpha-amylase family glycosyl hydrolase [Halobacillus amylolyticus]UOR13156.1 alpha-amylase family glycosyl hydrolase [Halobacillus amylolyticus]
MRKLATILMIIPFLLFCDLKAGAVEKEERTWQDESIYHIMVDRFMNGSNSNDHNVDPEDPEAYHGGDLQGIIEQLDYIKEMGFTTISLSPIMANSEKGYHGKWIEDFTAVEEHFGTVADAKQLVEEAHKRDMKVIFEFVVNHTSKDHPWLDEEGKEDWFHEKQPTTDQIEDGWKSGLPDLNTENPEVKQYLFEAAEFWIEETGVDGYRLDSVSYVPREFWADFSQHVKSVKEDFLLLGEVKSNDVETIADYQSTGIDTFVNYPFYQTASETFKEAGHPLDELYIVWEQSKQNFDSPQLLGNFLDYEDSARSTRLAVKAGQNPITRWKLGLTYLFTSPGIPMIYYGSEIPLDGAEPPANRKMMDFKAQNEKLNQRIGKLNSIRNEFPALTRGDFEELHNQDGLAVFKRTYNDETMIVAINNGTETQTAELTDLPDDRQMRGLLQDGLVRQSDDGIYKLGMERETADVFVIEPDQGYNWSFIAFVGGVMLLFVGSVITISIKNRRSDQ